MEPDTNTPQRGHALRRRVALWFERRFERSRDPSARGVVTGAEAQSLDGFAGHKHCLVVSFRRDGTPVPTPVWFGADGARIFFRSRASAAKVKRIAHNPAILLAPCDDKGAPLGAAVHASARQIDDVDKRFAETRIARNQGLDRRFYMRFFSTPPDDEAYFEVRLTDSPPAA